MVELDQLKCVACHSGEPSLSDVDIFRLHTQVSGWNVTKVDGVNRLERVFKFKNFAQSITFIERIAVLAEKENHHPRIIVEGGNVTLQWWTHKVKGLHLNDFIMAAKMDKLNKFYFSS